MPIKVGNMKQFIRNDFYYCLTVIFYGYANL